MAMEKPHCVKFWLAIWNLARTILLDGSLCRRNYCPGADDLAASGKGCESRLKMEKILSDGGQVENRIIEGWG